LKKRIVKTLVRSVALYGAETRTLREDETRRLDTLEKDGYNCLDRPENKR